MWFIRVFYESELNGWKVGLSVPTSDKMSPNLKTGLGLPVGNSHPT